MTPVLEVIRSELTQARRYVTALERSEALLAEADGDPSPRQAPSPNPTREDICAHVAEHGPVTRGEILRALGGSPNALSEKLKRLLAAGALSATGRPRRYRTAKGRRERTSRAETTFVTPPRAVHRNATVAVPEAGQHPVYDALAEHGSASTIELMALTNRTSGQVCDDARELTGMGLITFSGRGSDRVWHLAPRSSASSPGQP